MNINNDLAQSLQKSLLDKNNNCTLISHTKRLNRTDFFRKVQSYVEWLDQMNVNSIVVMSSPSIEALCLCYAIILSNRVYIPIHRSTGSELIKTYLEDYQIDLLVIESALSSQLDYSFNRTLKLTQDELFSYQQIAKQNRTMCILPGIIFFTSGSTGAPKAIHYNYNTLNHYLSWCVSEFQLTSTVHLLFTTELSFVASLRPLFVPTLSGANTVFIEGQNTNKLPLITNLLPKITTLNITPTLLKILVQHCQKNQCLELLASIQLILLSGEPIDCSVINHWINHINSKTIFYNLYGATEYLVPFYKKIFGIISEEEQLHLGQLRDGCQYTLINESQLCIAGEIATAYFNQQLNIDNYMLINHQRFIKTNDVVTVHNNNIYYHARSQRLIKRYSQLINLDHIEYALKQERNIPPCVAFADEAQDNKIYLIITSTDTENKTLLNHIKHHLETKLPRYMWPNEYFFTPEIPLTTSGKINYSQLKINYTQQKSHDIFSYFQRFFHEEVVDREARITDLGLESIDYIEMTEAFYKITGKWLNVSKITDQIRISNIDTCLEDLNNTALKQNDRVKLNKLQEAFYQQEIEDSPSNKIKYGKSFIYCYQLMGIIDISKLIKAIKATLNNHFLLTSRLVRIENDYFFIKSPHQQHHFMLTTPFFLTESMFDKLAVSVHDDRLINIYIQKRKKTCFLVMAYHHILLDGWGSLVLREEIFRRYEEKFVTQNRSQAVEIDLLNQANQIKFTQCSTDELKKLMLKVDYPKYHHLETLFNGTLVKNYSCFYIKKETIDQFAMANTISDMPYGVIFAWFLHQMIASKSKTNKIIFYTTLSNRNLPIPKAKELCTNLAIGLPIFLDNTNYSTREFAIKIREMLSIYFKNMSYSAIEKIWTEETIERDVLILKKQKYPIIFTYISNMLKNEYVQNKYIEWPKSFNRKIHQDKKCALSFRVYNMGQHFVIQLHSTINKGVHKYFVDYLNSNLLK